MKIKKKSTLIAILMSVLLCLSLMPITAFAEPGDVAIDATNFPDANFRTYVSTNFDRNDDGILSQSELDAVREIKVTYNHIATLKGVEHFKKLENLKCDQSHLTVLDVSHNPALTDLDCKSNQLTALDVSHNPALKKLYCNHNQLTALDVSNSALTELDCRNNQLTVLDVSHNPALTDLDCRNNQLTALDVSHNPALTYFECEDNQLTALDVSHNPALTVLNCKSNQLTALDVSHNPALTHLYCGGNQLTVLDVSHNPELKDLMCGYNQLTNLDLTANPQLKYFYGFGQKYDIVLGKNVMTFDLKSLTGNFDPSKAEGWFGDANVSGNTLKLYSRGSSTVTYFYRVIPLDGLYVTLNISHKDEVKISFDKNGGSGTMADVIKKAGETYVLPACDFTAPAGKEFKAWEVGGVEKAVGESITVNEDSTVKALWQDKAGTPIEKVTVNFDNNGGAGTMADATVDKGSSYTLPKCTFTAPAGKEFKSWEVNGVEKAVGDSITVNDNTKVKALWKNKVVTPGTNPGTQDPGTPNPGTNPGTPGITPTVEKFMITVNPSGGNWNGSTAAKTYEIEKGQYLTLPAAPTKDGYTFLYWKGSKYQPGDKYLVEGNHTFTAVWQKKPVKIASDATAPKTGDNGMRYVYSLGLLAAACGMLVLNTKRSKNK